MADGFVFKTVRGLWYVESEGQALVCSARGKLRTEGITPLVGDRVMVTNLGGGKGSLEAILSRKNSFVRPAVANLDVLVILASAVIPITEPYLIDRMIAIAELKGCRPVVCFHKSDIARSPELIGVYRGAGIDCVETSAVTGEGISELRTLLGGCFCAFTGNSGVGKSSLLNMLLPELKQEIQSVSEKHGRGKHTTRHTELFCFRSTAWVADTPGFAALEIRRLSKLSGSELEQHFPEFPSGICRFPDCRHDREPDCVVKRQVEEGAISPSRYQSYLRMLKELKNPERS